MDTFKAGVISGLIALDERGQVVVDRGDCAAYRVLIADSGLSRLLDGVGVVLHGLLALALHGKIVCLSRLQLLKRGLVRFQVVGAGPELVPAAHAVKALLLQTDIFLSGGDLLLKLGLLLQEINVGVVILLIPLLVGLLLGRFFEGGGHGVGVCGNVLQAEGQVGKAPVEVVDDTLHLHLCRRRLFRRAGEVVQLLD